MFCEKVTCEEHLLHPSGLASCETQNAKRHAAVGILLCISCPVIQGETASRVDVMRFSQGRARNHLQEYFIRRLHTCGVKTVNQHLRLEATPHV